MPPHIPPWPAIGTPRRREILRLCWTHERSAGDIHRQMGDVTFGAISQHLKVLTGAGLVTCRREGRHHFYRAHQASLGPLKQALEQMWDDALHTLKVKAELEAARRGPAPRSRP